MTARVTVKCHLIIGLTIPGQFVAAIGGHSIDNEDVVASYIVRTVEDTTQGLLGRVGVLAAVKVVSVHTVDVVVVALAEEPHLDLDGEVLLVCWFSMFGTLIVGEVHGELQCAHLIVAFGLLSAVIQQGEVEADGVTGRGLTKNIVGIIPSIHILRHRLPRFPTRGVVEVEASHQGHAEQVVAVVLWV